MEAMLFSEVDETKQDILEAVDKLSFLLERLISDNARLREENETLKKFLDRAKRGQYDQ